MTVGYKQTILGEIPIDWELVSIGDIADVMAGGTPSTKENTYWGGKIPWMNSGEINLRRVKKVEGRITEIGLKNSSTKLIPENSVLIALAGQGKTRGKVAINEFALCTNQSLATIYNFRNAYYEYIFQNLESRYTEIRKMSTGDGGRGGLNLKIIKSIKIQLPKLPEQQKIAEILNTVDTKIDIIDQQVIQTQELKKGLMQRLLTKGIGHTKFKESPLGKIPESWEVVKFENILKEERGSLGYGILQPGSGVENGINMVRTIDLTENGRADTEILKVPQKISDTSPTTVLTGGEVLLSVMGTLGRTFVVPKEWAGWNVNRALAVIRTKDIMENHFLSQFFRSPYFKKVIDRQSIGSAQLRINLNDLRKYEIPLPSIDEQIDISRKLNLVDEKIEVLSEKKKSYLKLKKGLMQQLFTGKVRVMVKKTH